MCCCKMLIMTAMMDSIKLTKALAEQFAKTLHLANIVQYRHDKHFTSQIPILQALNFKHKLYPSCGVNRASVGQVHTEAQVNRGCACAELAQRIPYVGVIALSGNRFI